MRSFILLLLLLFAGIGIFAESPADPAKKVRFDAVLSTVNGEPITLLDLLLECGGDEQALAQITESGILPSQIESVRRQALDQIIDRKLIWLDYQKHNYPIPNQLIEDAISNMAKTIADGSREGLHHKIKSLGITMEEVRRRATQQIVTDMMIREFCFRKINTTPRQLDSYYQTHLDAFTEPQQWDLALILLQQRNRTPVPAELIRKLDIELAERPEQFDALADRYSEAPGARDNHGYMGTFSLDKLRPEFADKLLAMPDTQSVSDSIVLTDGICYLKIIQRHPQKVIPFLDIREKIRDQIESPQRKAAILKYISKLRFNAVIRDYSDKDIVYESDIVSPLKVNKPKQQTGSPPPPGAAVPERRSYVQ